MILNVTFNTTKSAVSVQEGMWPGRKCGDFVVSRPNETRTLFLTRIWQREVQKDVQDVQDVQDV